MRPTMRPTPKIALAVAAVLALATPAVAQERPAQQPPSPGRTRPWDGDALRAFATIAVQDGGRVKPLDTLAGFKLLKLNGKRGVTTPTGESLTPTAWVLDCLFFPEQARSYGCFLIQNDEVLDAIGLSHETKKKRDRYSYDELAPAVQKLYELTQQYAGIEDKNRSVAQTQVVQLGHNVHEFEQLTHYLDFARREWPVRSTESLTGLFKDAQPSLATLLGRPKELIDLYRALNADKSKDPKWVEAQLAGIDNIIKDLTDVRHRATALALIPPTVPVAEQTEWLTVGDLVDQTFQTGASAAAQVDLVAQLEHLEHVKTDPAQFATKALALRDGLAQIAQARGEYSKVPLEVIFYKWDFFYKALILFLLAFVLIAGSWLRPHATYLVRGALSATLAGGVLVVAGIVLRCIIRSRPPVSTLYETILFITGTAVLTSLVVEWINRQRIAAAVAPVLGAAGMFLAMKYEFKEAASSGDTMPSLVAVLDTNFWLATHVTSVTLGYSAGLLASAIAHVWLVGKMLGLKREDTGFYKNVYRMTYGVLCFSLIFATVGTILGGIWANYSWGRFWGWDPKENGALMICLWELAILHARLGGYVRDFGFAVANVLCGLVIAFSWWGVNLLGVGLHSYGFTSGVAQVLAAFYGLELLLVLLGCGWWLAQREGAVPPAPQPALDAKAPPKEAEAKAADASAPSDAKAAV